MKENFVFCLPPQIYFGEGEGKKTGELVKRWGKKALLVTGKKSMQETGILDEILQSLEEAGVQCSIFDQVEPEPSLETVDGGLDIAYREQCQLVISLGGGSAQDCGKAIAGLCGNAHTVLPYFEG
ncbi:MAG TPA: iron-containing alcohol dehydrogenase, partial [Candidatus Atribacteria bacterium]|nr:iron-containing alcohol dehydrogenase [Candidatus Atribacteria bacterium]